MPLLRHIQYTESSHQLALWQISESISTLAALANLSEEEQQELAKIKLEKRKKEWLSVRIMLREFAPGLELSFLPSGKPRLTGGRHISISHCANLGGLLLSSKSVGLDIQSTDARIQRIEHKFTNDRERSYLPATSDRVEYLTVIWSVKEAVFKYFGERVDFSEDVTVSPFEPDQPVLQAEYNGIHGCWHFELTSFQMAGCHIIFTSNARQIIPPYIA